MIQKTTKSVMESQMSIDEGSPVRTQPHKQKRYSSNGVSHYSSMHMQKKDNKTQIIKGGTKRTLHASHQRGHSSFQINEKNKNSMNSSAIYKQRIIDQRKSNLKPHKQRSYSIDACFNKKKSLTGSKDKKIDNVNLRMSQAHASKQKRNQVSFTGVESICIPFLLECIEQQGQFIEQFKKGKYQKSQSILINLLNYSVDLNDRKLFLNLVNILGQFHIICENYEAATKFFIQLLQGAILQKMYLQLIKALIGISECCDQVNLFTEGMKFLKKGLDYAWLGNYVESELKIYDLMGKKFYRMGNMKKAQFYHQRYITASIEPIESPLRKLSKQTTTQQEESNYTHQYNNISALFLVHLNLPMKNRSALPSLNSDLVVSARDKLPDLPPKKSFIKSKTDQIDYQIRKIIKHWVFNYESDEITIVQKQSYEKSDKSVGHKNRKNAYLEFKMNQQLRQKGIIIQKNQQVDSNNSPFKKCPSFMKKENLEEKVKKLMDDPGLHQGWYKQIVGRVKADQRRKLSEISDRVRLGGGNTHNNEKINSLRNLYRSIIQFVTQKSQVPKKIYEQIRRRKNF